MGATDLCDVLQKRQFVPKSYVDRKYNIVLPTRTRVVISGGGLVGAAVAYFLAKAGWGKHTVLLEQAHVGCSTPWHQTGMVTTLNSSLAEVNLSQCSIGLIKELTIRGYPTGWKQCGSLSLAKCVDRMIVFRRMKSQAVSWGIDCELLTPEQVKDVCPIIQTIDLVGGLWVPSDGVYEPRNVCVSLIQEAYTMGVQIIEHCAVTKVLQNDGKVHSVDTSSGTIECKYFINCSGFWAREVGTLSRPIVKIPLHPVEHYYMHTKPIIGVKSNTPFIRDMDSHIYLRFKNDGCCMAGGFEIDAKPAYEDGNLPLSQSERILPPDWDHFYKLLTEMVKCVPLLKKAEIDRLCNSPEMFAPDCQWILGESPEIINYFVSTGMKTVGISAAGGIGRALVDLIIKQCSPIELYKLDISRFLGLHNNRKFLRDRCREVPGLYYRIQYPFDEFKTGRNLRMSPIYPALKEVGAVFGQTMGYERPNYFDPRDKVDDFGIPRYRIADTSTFGKPPWFDFVSVEYNACRERIGIADYSSFTKIDLNSKGREVVDLLQYLCSNDVDVPVGSIIHTGMQNEIGGYENDCSLARIAENYYMMISPTIQQTRCKAWLAKYTPSFGRVNVSDVTSMYTAICIMGPYTRLVLSELTDTDLSAKNFPFFTYRELDVGLANGIRVMNLTHTGELGYVLYVPNEFALHVYSRLWEAGQRYGIQHAGYYATRTLRIEKFYAFWGQDLDTFTTPLECGRSWRVKFDKNINFVGREALLRQKKEGVRRMYVQLILNDHDPEVDLWCWGGEPIYRDGKYCGDTTTTGYGFTFKKQVCLGFVRHFDDFLNTMAVTNDYVLKGNYEVDIAGIRYEAKVNLHSPNLPTKFPDRERAAYQATRGKEDHIALPSYER